MAQQEDGEETGNARRKHLELSVPQVAGSAFAAVVAAVLASKLGVYGTIIGAGLVSVIATCGGTVFQHLFRRTGEQIREVSVQVKPRVLKAPVLKGPVRSEPGTADAGAVPPTLTGARPQDTGHPSDQFLPEGEYTEATVHGTRIRGWKRSSVAAVVVFLVAMSGITGAELLSGHDLDGGLGTTVGSIVHGGSAEKPAPSPSRSDTTTDREQAPNGNRNDGGSPSRTPAPSSGSDGNGSSAPDPGQSGSTTGPVPSPAQSSPGVTSPSQDATPSAGDGTGKTGPDNSTASPAE